MHEIFAKKVSHDVKRLFIGWRLTQEDESLMTDKKLREILSSGAIVPTKSSDLPPMWAKLHWVNWRERIQEWSIAALRPELLEEKKVPSSNQWCTIAPRYMPSLEDMDAKWVPYGDHEINILCPTKMHK